MTPKIASSMPVDILIGTDVVGTTTTRADGSWSCQVPIALGQQTFVARAGDETSDPYALTAAPPQAVTDNFNDLPEGRFSYADRIFMTIDGMGSRLEIYHGFNNRPPFLDNGKFAIIANTDTETRLTFKLKTPTNKVSYGFIEDVPQTPTGASIIYYYNTGENVSLTNPKGPLWVEHIAPESRYITDVVFLLPRRSGTLIPTIYVDNFSIYV